MSEQGLMWGAFGLLMVVMLAVNNLFASLTLAIAASFFSDRNQDKQTVPVENN